MVLYSIIIELRPTMDMPLVYPLGRPAQAWFLNQLTLHNPALTETLHDETGPKPYTLSTLLNDRGIPLEPGTWLQKGGNYWLRMTTCEENLSDLVLRKMLPRMPGQLTLYKMNFRIDGYTLDPEQHPWAGQISFKDLAEDSEYIQPASKIKVEFVSPTAFRSNGRDISIPQPEHVFRSWWQKWNAFAPESMQIQDFWPNFVSAGIYIDELIAINTQRWAFADEARGAATGFTGTVGFELLPKRKIPDQWKPFWDGAAAVMQSLARFAFYCGTGHHTTIGLGQTNLVK